MTGSRQSPIVDQLTRLVALGAGPDDLGLTEPELAALAYDWDLWCRPNQQIPPVIELSDPPPEGARWPLWGRTRPGEPWRVGLLIGGRGTGKTSAANQYAHKMAITGQWPSYVCCAQTMDKAVKIFVTAPNGLVRGVPPWEAPVASAGPGGEGMILRYRNGSVATITSAAGVDERGPEYYGARLTEVAYWPRSRALSAWNTILDATRAGDGQVLVDSTPAAGDPIIEAIKDQAELYRNVWWIRHAAGDNALHNVVGYEDDMRRRYAGTAKEQEEVDGTEGKERGMVRRADIEAARRHQPSIWRRRIVIVDPPYTSPFEDKRPDTAGVVSMGEGPDGQLYVTDDKSGVKPLETWATEAAELYIVNHCDCMTIETNRGGQMPTALIRAMADKKGWAVVVVKLEAKTRYVPGTIYVKEVFAEHDKWTRGELMADLYRDGRISHLIGADLDSLERTLTGWYPKKPSERSPGDLDAVAWGCRELAGHLQERAISGIGQLAAAARAAGQVQPRQDLTRLWPQSSGDGRATGSRI